MKQIRILIVEDEPIIADDIAYTLEEIGYTITGIAHDAHDALLHIELEMPDLVLLDINLSGPVDGITVAQQLKDKFRIPFLFLTSLSDRGTLEKAKVTEPAGYLVKPVDEGDLLTSIEVAMYNHSTAGSREELQSFLIKDAIFIKDHYRLVKVLISDILYAEADNNYCFIHTIDKRYILSLTLKAVSEKLEDWNFVRIHRGYLINPSHISEITDRQVIIQGHKLPISKMYHEDFMKSIRMM